MESNTTHIGVLPYRLNKKKQIEILLIKNRGDYRWMLPKGHKEKGMSNHQVGLMEAFEEAGIKGNILSSSPSSYYHPKRNSKVKVSLYLMRVTRSIDHWQEEKQRKREWFSYDAARKKIWPVKLRKALPLFMEIILKQEALMKEICFIRHGKSSQKIPGLKDIERPLSKRGQRDSIEMGKKLALRDFFPDLIISSPADRAISTARLIANQLNYKKIDIRIEENLYLCDVDNIKKIIVTMKNKYKKLIIVAHNPAISMAETYFTGQKREKFPTGALFIMEADSWKNYQKGICREIFYDYPKNVLH